MDDITKEFIEFENENAVTLTGYDDAIIGMAYSYGKNPVVLYSIEKVLEKLMEDGMERDEAFEFFDYNILGSYISENNPIFMMEFEKTKN